MTQTIINLGTGGAVLNGQNGSSAGADSNDALYLDWTGENYVYLPGVASNSLSVPDEAALDITGDIDIRVQVSMDDWTPAATQILVAKRSTGQWSYQLDVSTAGLLRFQFTEDGSTSVLKSSTVATGLTDETVKWVRATVDVDNGSSGYDVKFWMSDDGVTWTQLGATVTTAGVITLYSGTSVCFVGSRGAPEPTAGKFYRAQVLDGIDGTKVLDIDTSVITSGAATTFTALTGQTVTINRSTAGRKSVAVVSPVWLFGTDDYMEVADNDLLDFGASDSFTVLAVVRQWATPANNGTLVSKREQITQQGYLLRQSGTTFVSIATVHDGTTNYVDSSAAVAASSTLTIHAQVVDRAGQTLTAYQDDTPSGSPTDITAAGSFVNAGELRIGRQSQTGTAYQNFELVAVAVFRRALTAAEISAITAYYQARLS
jgi:hypothetical protein